MSEYNLEIELQPMTKELCHEFYKEYVNDTALYMDMSFYELYQYSKESVDRYYEKQQKKERKIYAIMQNKKVIGELKLKNIDYTKHICTMGIVLQKDEYKGKGYGTQAERCALDIAFGKLEMQTVYADVVLKNTRSQHILEKLGFHFIKEDEMLRYYKKETNRNKKIKDNRK